MYWSLIFLVGCANNSELQTSQNENYDNEKSLTFETISTGSLQTGDVLIELTPAGIKNGKFEVEITANTHSVDLSQFDLMQIITLEYNNKKLKPISALKLSGHHSSGTIAFSMSEQPPSFGIIITDIPLVEKRIFEWP